MGFIIKHRIISSLILFVPLYFLSLTLLVYIPEDDADAAIGLFVLWLPMLPFSYILSVVLVGFISSIGAKKSNGESIEKTVASYTLSVGLNLVKYTVYFVVFIVLAYLIAALAIWVMSGFSFTSV